MSLKSFHIFFIVVSTLTTFGFGLWSVAEFLKNDDSTALLLGVLSLIVTGLLVWYGIRFFKKLRQMVPTRGNGG